MKKSAVLQFAEGSAERVVAHARWQRSRGRNPSMSFCGVRNPREALFLAEVVIEASQGQEFIHQIVELGTRGKTFDDMTDKEVELAVRRIIADSSSEEEVERRLREELDYHGGISLCCEIPEDETGREARELVRGLGGLVMKNGAMVMGMMHGHDSVIYL